MPSVSESRIGDGCFAKDSFFENPYVCIASTSISGMANTGARRQTKQICCEESDKHFLVLKRPDHNPDNPTRFDFATETLQSMKIKSIGIRLSVECLSSLRTIGGGMYMSWPQGPFVSGLPERSAVDEDEDGVAQPLTLTPSL